MGRPGETFDDVLARRLGRRRFLGELALGGALLLHGRSWGATPAARVPARGLTFTPVAASTADTLVVPEGYVADIVISWGDPLHAEHEGRDIASAADQEVRFGFNCDYNGFFPLPSERGDRGLLCVNHEYTRASEMFPDFDKEKGKTRAQVEIEMAAHGMSIIELARADGRWAPVPGARRTRRITATTPMRLTGAAAGHPWFGGDTTAHGMLNNCAGGKTPWGTVLTCEENTHNYFGNAGCVSDEARRDHYRAYGIREKSSPFRWEEHFARFDLEKTPGEAARFGWVVEIDPLDPESTPRKRTSLGRCSHEGANTAVARDGRVVVYTGDDRAGQFVYKFVSARPWDPRDRAANRDLLDDGTLHVARFDDDGSGAWLPLVPEGPLAKWTRADILMRVREAARLLGATPMDRPEDIEVNPVNNRVYIACTKNGKSPGDNAANPRSPNPHGHVIEFDEEGGDLGATAFTWTVFLACGDPEVHEGTFYAGADLEKVNPVSCPDNLAFDPGGHLWIATDGQAGSSSLRVNDSVYAVATAGPDRGLTKRFLTGPVGAEICGPEFTPDGRTLFVNIQHPGEGGGLAKPRSRWPHGDMPRPSVVAVRRIDGGVIGS